MMRASFEAATTDRRGAAPTADADGTRLRLAALVFSTVVFLLGCLSALVTRACCTRQRKAPAAAPRHESAQAHADGDDDPERGGGTMTKPRRTHVRVPVREGE